MIGSLRGHVLYASESEIIFDVNGTGYRVAVAAATRHVLESSDGEVTLWIHTQLRQDALQLFGFASLAERDVFEILLTTPGVGPSLALAILATLGSDGVVAAVGSEDAAVFESVSGVGKKTAARLVLELQGKLAGLTGKAPTAGNQYTESPETGDIAIALSQLGYSADEVRRALSVLDGTESVETALRLSLRELSRR